MITIEYPMVNLKRWVMSWTDEFGIERTERWQWKSMPRRIQSQREILKQISDSKPTHRCRWTPRGDCTLGKKTLERIIWSDRTQRTVNRIVYIKTRKTGFSDRSGHVELNHGEKNVGNGRVTGVRSAIECNAIRDCLNGSIDSDKWRKTKTRVECKVFARPG